MLNSPVEAAWNFDILNYNFSVSINSVDLYNSKLNQILGQQTGM